MIEETYLKLHFSESTVAEIASRLLSAYIVSGQLSESNEDELISKSLKLAIKLAHQADKVIDSDNESRE